MNNPLYILVSKNLNLAYQGVQSLHAACLWLLDNKDQQTWNNQTVVVLEVDNVERWKEKLDMLGIDNSPFIEPDIGNVMTAVACQHDRHSIFRKLKLMGAS